MKRKMKDKGTLSTQTKRALRASFALLILITGIPSLGIAQEQAQSLFSASALMAPLLKQSFSSSEGEETSNMSGVANDTTNEATNKVSGETTNEISSETSSTTTSDNANVLEVNEIVSNMGIKTQAGVSDAFTNECFDVSEYANLIVSENEEIISFTSRECASETFFNIAQKLERAGWTYAKSGVECQGTFIKDDGEMQWLYVASLQYGEGSCVVIQTS